jgi:hypothetical protein
MAEPQTSSPKGLAQKRRRAKAHEALPGTHTVMASASTLLERIR